MKFYAEASYRSTALAAYGTKCEWEGCTWEHTSCDVHHIDYIEQQGMEKRFRSMLDSDYKFSAMWFEIQRQAEAKGWGTFNVQDRQLHKNDHVSNLAVLCPNHHRLVHEQDLGKQVLKHIPARKSE